MSDPKVSVLIPAYNQEEVIEQTVMSSLTQDYDNLEVVVSDDASTDGTPQILNELEAKYPGRLKVFLHETNLGVTKNHTRGLLECSGDFIAFQDGDDLFLPGKIKKQVAFMQAHPDCTISSHDVDVFDSESGKTLYLWSQRFGQREGGMRELVRYGNYLSSVSVMVRRTHLPPYGYDDRIRIGSDWLLWLETLSRGKGRICYLDEVLARYRRHTGNLTNAFGWKYEDQLITLSLVETKWPHLLFPARMRRSEIQFMAGVSAFSARRLTDARRYFLESAALGFPFFPWLRLMWRELFFWLRHRNSKDDILGSVVAVKETTK
ncbi:MAG TPA: glycosyltransferase [Anaerolineales bacterium]|nr:glycosyltransferase [Anaerolineales bacterium]